MPAEDVPPPGAPVFDLPREAAAMLLSDQPLPNERLKVMVELHRAERRLASLLAILPVIGAWWLSRDTVLSELERRKLWALWGASTLSLVALLWLAVPRTSERPSETEKVVRQRIQVLAGIAEAYRSEHGTYPDPGEWHRSARRGDLRFYDRWARPFLLGRDSDGTGFTISTLGRDGVLGGQGEDADIEQHFTSPPS